MTSDFRHIPSVDQLINSEDLKDALQTFGHDWTVAATREVLETCRADLKAQKPLPSLADIVQRIEHRLALQSLPDLQKVINATGVLLHTNLGRAPLSNAAAKAASELSQSFNTLEFNLETGKRGSRESHCAAFIARLSGAEDALVVNNNAGAVLLALSALAKAKKVAISRSQLVEIGGGFRIPDVMRQSGAKLLEVGTTNRTHLRDYETAIAEGAQMLMTAHQSNFQILGFTAEPELVDIAELAKQAQLPLYVDLGSGSFVNMEKYGLSHEPTVPETIAQGADLVSFSGDKLLGGPQAGILAGRKELIDKCRRHPLYRALRPDKLCLAALSATLLHYLTGDYELEIPLYRMLAQSESQIRQRAQAWQKQHGTGEVIKAESTIGGGSLPGETLPTWLLQLKPKSANQLLKALREQKPPIIARIQDHSLVLDPRTVQENEDIIVTNTLKKLLN